VFLRKQGALLLRASYNRRGEQVNGIFAGLNSYSDPYQQVDLNASWYVLKDLSINGSVINLTRSVDRQHLGNDTTAALLLEHLWRPASSLWEPTSSSDRTEVGGSLTPDMFPDMTEPLRQIVVAGWWQRGLDVCRRPHTSAAGIRHCRDPGGIR